MYLKQSDLFWGISQNVIQSITAKAVQQEFQADDIIFKTDEPADCFYVLIKGRVRLELRATGCKIYSSDRVGEIFGWSALIGRKGYSATVICEKQTMVLKFHKKNIQLLLDQDPESAAIFYKQLASALGNRLLAVYELLN
ncbi:MAG: cyclic nucleotide-binding domain-containing protein [Desulfobacteraceae bacterium]|jgi:CRP-like cAMP-binding protein